MSFGEDLHCYEVFPGTLHRSDGSSKFMEDCETGVLTKTRRGTKERDQKLQGHCAHIGDVEVVRILFHSVSGKKEREPDNWMKLYVGGEHGQVAQHSQSVIRPTICLASLDIKTAFDEARPRHVAKSKENHPRDVRA